jgi:hypothetical protein
LRSGPFDEPFHESARIVSQEKRMSDLADQLQATLRDDVAEYVLDVTQHDRRLAPRDRPSLREGSRRG